MSRETGQVAGVHRVGRSERQLRSDALRMLAHDLRNPVTALRLHAETLRNEAPTASVRRDAIEMLESADQLEAYIECLTSMALMDGGPEELTWFPVNLVDVIRDVVNRPWLRGNVQLNLPQTLIVDGAGKALRRALLDVIVNARKLTRSGRRVAVSLETEVGAVSIRVHHPGGYISPGLRERLLEMHGAVELRRHHLPVVCGGLVYASSVIDAHHGTIVFEDAVGRDGQTLGMDVVIRLPR